MNEKPSSDREIFLNLLGETAERFDLGVYAYVLMINHCHILLKTNRSNLSQSMQLYPIDIIYAIKEPGICFRAGLKVS